MKKTKKQEEIKDELNLNSLLHDMSSDEYVFNLFSLILDSAKLLENLLVEAIKSRPADSVVNSIITEFIEKNSQVADETSKKLHAVYLEMRLQICSNSQVEKENSNP